MASAKQIILKVIPAKTAQEFIRQHHYSGKVVANSKLHFGCFIGGVLHGVMSYGSPMDKAKVINLVSNTKWNEMLELNRMAFDDTLPKNSESRCLAISFRLIRRNAPHINMRRQSKSKAAEFHSVEGGAIPTLAHQFKHSTRPGRCLWQNPRVL